MGRGWGCLELVGRGGGLGWVGSPIAVTFGQALGCADWGWGLGWA